MSLRRLLPPLFATLLLAGCAPAVRPPATPAPAPLPPPRLGLALGGGAAKGYAHIGVIKMLEAHGIHADVVAGTSAGSVVGALYAGGLDGFALQRAAMALDPATLRDVRLFSGGLVRGQALQDYVNTTLDHTPIERLEKPFAAVATELETGRRTVFTRGNTGEAVRASCSIPGVFEPAAIGLRHYVDGGVSSPVPVDAARALGADVVIAVDIGSRADGSNPEGMLAIVGQSIDIMGQQLGAQELARADVVIRPRIDAIGTTAFDRREEAILAGEQATLAALPAIRKALAAARAGAASAP
ncbi:MAG TPA: patatin-like phospholipase family protein [Dyella sp.]|nr:patatin-like phospholipase family protein [Dyella sp.]